MAQETEPGCIVFTITFGISGIPKLAWTKGPLTLPQKTYWKLLMVALLWHQKAGLSSPVLGTVYWLLCSCTVDVMNADLLIRGSDNRAICWGNYAPLEVIVGRTEKNKVGSMSGLISLRDTAGSQQGRVFGRQWLAKMMQTGSIGICALGTRVLCIRLRPVSTSSVRRLNYNCNPCGKS